MASLLRRLGKNVTVCNYEKVPHSLQFLPGAKSIKTSKKLSGKFDAAIIFECNDAARMGNIVDLKKQVKVVVNVDPSRSTLEREARHLLAKRRFHTVIMGHTHVPLYREYARAIPKTEALVTA